MFLFLIYLTVINFIVLSSFICLVGLLSAQDWRTFPQDEGKSKFGIIDYFLATI
jgi:hypothetical protein